MKIKNLTAWKIWLGTAAVAIIATIPLMYHNCAQVDLNKQYYSPIGQEVTAYPLADNHETKLFSDYKHLIIFFILGGQSLNYDDDVTIQMFGKDDSLVYSVHASELLDITDKTNCPREIIDLLDNSVSGDVAFCNNSFDISKVTHFVALKPNKKPKTATSYITNFVREDLDTIEISVGF